MSGTLRELTCVGSSHRTLNNDSRQTFEPGQGIENLLKGRELCHHIEKECDQPGVMMSAFSTQAFQADTIYVNRLKYNAVTMPYLCLVHSVRTKPCGHFFRIMGPRKPKIKIGKDEESV